MYLYIWHYDDELTWCVHPEPELYTNFRNMVHLFKIGRRLL